MMAHADARVVHACVRWLGSRKSVLLIQSGARAEIPDWNPVIPERRIIPMWKGPKGRIERIDGEVRVVGQIRQIWNKSRNPVGCWIDYEGIPQAEAEAMTERARIIYAEWWHGLFELSQILSGEDALMRWQVTETGASPEPWRDGELTKYENRKILPVKYVNS